jgi:glutamate--cysteine ligase catalytic subunit
MKRAHARDAGRDGRFWFRKHMAPPKTAVEDPDGFEEMSAAEILTGKGDYFPGLIPLIEVYLEFIDCDPETAEQMRLYLNFIRLRATGELQTPAQWMRSFIYAHPEYKHDSRISQAIAADLVRACVDIAEGRRHEPRLLGEHRISPLRTEDAWYVPLKIKKEMIERARRTELLESYASRAKESVTEDAARALGVEVAAPVGAAGGSARPSGSKRCDFC